MTRVHFRHAVAIAALLAAIVLVWSASGPFRVGNARQFVARLSNDVLREEEAISEDEIDCSRTAHSLSRMTSAYGCTIPTPCGDDVMVVAYASPLRGLHRSGDPIWWAFARTCLRILREDIQREARRASDTGG